jgi:tetratricopeptide (TPR) repeat protein
MDAVKEARRLNDVHRFAEACSRYEAAVRLDPSNAEAARGWIDAASRAGRLSEVEAFFARRTLDAPADPAAHLGLGLAIAGSGQARIQESLRHLEKAAALSPSDGDTAGRLGLVAGRAGRWDTAQEALAKAVSLDGGRARWRVAHARSLAETGHRAAAASELEAMLTLSPSREDIAQARGVSRVLDKAYRALPAASSARLGNALELIRMDEVVKAGDELAELAATHPERAVIVAAQGLCARAANDAPTAVTTLRHALEVAPDAAEPALLLADFYACREKRDEARALYVRATHADPMLSTAYRRLAELETQAGDKTAALGHWSTYALVEPDDLPARLVHAALLEATPGHDATSIWNALAEDFPASPEVLMGRARWNYGVALEATGARRSDARGLARHDVERLLSLDPENQAAQRLLAEIDRL